MAGTVTPQQAQFLDRLTEARDRLLLAIAGLGEDVLTSDHVLGCWTVKDIIGHVISWNDEFRENIAMILQGEHPGHAHQISGEDDFDAWNQEWISQKKDWTLEQILDDLERDHQAEKSLILRLKPEDLRQRGVTPWKHVAGDRAQPITEENSDSVETLVTFHWRHMNQHAGDIEKWRKKLVSKKR